MAWRRFTHVVEVATPVLQRFVHEDPVLVPRPIVITGAILRAMWEAQQLRNKLYIDGHRRLRPHIFPGDLDLGT